jgi:hypothetical protein
MKEIHSCRVELNFTILSADAYCSAFRIMNIKCKKPYSIENLIHPKLIVQ